MVTIDFQKRINFKLFEELLEKKTDITIERDRAIYRIRNKYGRDIHYFLYKDNPNFLEIATITNNINSWYKGAFKAEIVDLFKSKRDNSDKKSLYLYDIKSITTELSNKYEVKNISEGKVRSLLNENQNSYNYDHYLPNIAEIIYFKKYGDNGLITEFEIKSLFLN